MKSQWPQDEHESFYTDEQLNLLQSEHRAEEPNSSVPLIITVFRVCAGETLASGYLVQLQARIHWESEEFQFGAFLAALVHDDRLPVTAPTTVRPTQV